MKKIICVLFALMLLLPFTGCSNVNNDTEEATSFKIGICNYVDDASLNQIVQNITEEINELASKNNVTITIDTQNCNADANVLNQIIANFISDDVDLMVAVATPVALAMQAATEENRIPVIFAAVSDPMAAGLVDSLDAPGGNISGTSDFLDTTAIMNLITALNPEIKKVGLLYDLGQDSSLTAISDAKVYLKNKGIEIVERTGTNVSEVQLAADALIADQVEAIFTPSDNTVMNAQLSIYERLRDAGIPHFAGADSFALNGAFLGYGVDYANLGRETGAMVFDVLVNGTDISTLPVKMFDNGTATINTEIAEALGFNYDTLTETFKPYCSKIQPIRTSESFE